MSSLTRLFAEYQHRGAQPESMFSWCLLESWVCSFDSLIGTSGRRSSWWHWRWPVAGRPPWLSKLKAKNSFLRSHLTFELYQHIICCVYFEYQCSFLLVFVSKFRYCFLVEGILMILISHKIIREKLRHFRKLKNMLLSKLRILEF